MLFCSLKGTAAALTLTKRWLRVDRQGLLRYNIVGRIESGFVEPKHYAL